MSLSLFERIKESISFEDMYNFLRPCIMFRRVSRKDLHESDRNHPSPIIRIKPTNAQMDFQTEIIIYLIRLPDRPVTRACRVQTKAKEQVQSLFTRHPIILSTLSNINLPKFPQSSKSKIAYIYIYIYIYI